MNKKIVKVREDIKKTQARIRELEEYLRTLKNLERQLCDEEIAKTIREMAGKGDVMETLRQLMEEQSAASENVYAGNAFGREEMEEHD